MTGFAVVVRHTVYLLVAISSPTRYTSFMALITAQLLNREIRVSLRAMKLSLTQAACLCCVNVTHNRRADSDSGVGGADPLLERESLAMESPVAFLSHISRQNFAL